MRLRNLFKSGEGVTPEAELPTAPSNINALIDTILRHCTRETSSSMIALVIMLKERGIATEDDVIALNRMIKEDSNIGSNAGVNLQFSGSQIVEMEGNLDWVYYFLGESEPLEA